MNGRGSPAKWMKPVNLEKLPDLSNQERHQALKNRFNAMKFQLLGNGPLADYVIRFNLFGAVQPGTITSFYERWRLHTQTDDYRKAKQESEKAEPDHVRRSKKMYRLKEKVWRADLIAGWIAENPRNWYELESSDKELFNQIDELRTQLSDLRRTPPRARHAGAGSAIANV